MRLIKPPSAIRQIGIVLAMFLAFLGLSATTATSASAATTKVTASAVSSVATTATPTAKANVTTVATAVKNCSSVSSNWPTLVRYDTGTCVKFAQNRLAVWEFLDGTMPADGNFGPGMLRSVLAFQKARGLVQDGKIGPATEAALKQTPPPNGP